MKEIYFDTNVYTHIYNRQAGVTDHDEITLKAAIRADKIRILTSTQVVEETIAAVLTSPKEAIGRLKLIHKLAKRKRMIKFHTDFVQAVRAYGTGDKIRSAFISPPAPFSRILSNPDVNELANIAAETKAEIQKHHDKMADAFKTKIEPLAQPIRQQRLQPSFDEYWNQTAIPYLEELASRAGVLKECQNRGLEGLLAIRSIHTATLGQLSLIYANTYEGRVPKRSDSRDMHHVLLSSATDALITNDDNLRRIMGRKPKADYVVMNFRELLTAIS